MKLSNEKIEYIAKQILKETKEKLKKINNVEPGDTLKINYKFQLKTSIDKKDVI